VKELTDPCPVPQQMQDIRPNPNHTFETSTVSELAHRSVAKM